MTTPEMIAHRLHQALGSPELRLKAKQQERHLMILVERPEEMDLDYEALSQWFAAALRSMPGVAVDQLSLYSRKQGERKPDWQTQLQLTSPADHPPEEIVESSDPEAEAEPDILDLSSYCFIRNELLLRTSLPVPPAQIQQQIMFFHKLSDGEKLDVLPVLTTFFKDPDTVSLDSLPEEHREWFEQMRQLDEQRFKTISIWLSRYCADPEKALEESQASDPPAPVSPPPEQSHPQSSTPDTPPSTGPASPHSHTRSRSVAPTRSQDSNQGSMILSILCHLSSYFMPLILPLILFFVASDPVVKANARSCLGFNLGITGYYVLTLMLFWLSPWLGIFGFLVVLVYNLILPLVATIVCATKPGTVFRYPGMPG